MVEHGVSELPGIDAEGRRVGIISAGELIVCQQRRKKAPW
jgi:CBS domain-containing protein